MNIVTRYLKLWTLHNYGTFILTLLLLKQMIVSYIIKIHCMLNVAGVLKMERYPLFSFCFYVRN